MLLTKRTHFMAVILLVLGVLFLPALVGPRQAAAQDGSWRARYWNNRNLSGDPVLRRDEPNIDHDWGHNGPGSPVPDDNFSARWTRDVDFAAGNYRFSATTDDGMRVWIDDQLVIDSWTDSQVHTVTADRSLSAGRHSIRVEYYEAGGVAVARFSWAPISGNQPSVFTGWRGEYFANINLSGAPTALRDDGSINFNWGTGSPLPGIPADQFSVRWTRTLDFPAGTYTFEVFSDDGARLWVNNQMVVDQWRDQSDGRTFATLNLPGGATPLRLEYYENTGRAAVSLSWNPPLGTGVPSTPPPTTSPTTPPPGTPAAIMNKALYLNVRDAPSMEAEVIDHLSRDQVVPLTGYQSPGGFWLEIRLPSGQTGWASASYLTANVGTTTFPTKSQ